MFLKKSRYRETKEFDLLPDDSEVFPGVRPREIGPANGMIEHEVKAGDRLDLLARHYYNNDRLWWRILDANPEFFYGQSFHKDREEQGKHGSPKSILTGVMLSPDMEGSIILIPKATE